MFRRQKIYLGHQNEGLDIELEIDLGRVIRDPLDQQHKAHTSPVVSRICVRFDPEETKKDLRPIVVSPFVIRCAKEDLNLHDRIRVTRS